MSYRQEYSKSIHQSQEFWREKAKDLDWFQFPKTILSQG